MNVSTVSCSKGRGTQSFRGKPLGCTAAVSVTPILLLLGTTNTFAAAEEKTSNVLEQVIVTARYRQENLQETPIAITAVSGEELATRSLTRVEDIGATVPNAFIRPGLLTSSAPVIGIRGATQTDFIYAFEPAVAVYLDDVYHGTLTGSSFDLMDIERLEVLRGPQGTLFGKNSLGGAIRLVSKKPVGDNSGYVEATYGQFNRLDVKAAYDFSVVPEKLFMRMTALSKHRDGYMDRLDFTCQMIANGTPQLAGIGDGIGGAVQVASIPGFAPGAAPIPIYAPVMVPVGSAADNAFSFPTLQPASRRDGCKLGTLGGEDTHAARVALRFLATDKLEVNFAADYTDQNNEPPAATIMTKIGPGLDTLYGGAVIFPRYGITYNADNRFVTGNPYTTYATFANPLTGAMNGAVDSTKAWGVSGTADYRFSDTLHAKFITAYRTYSNINSTDSDATPFELNGPLNLQDHRQYSAELQVGGSLFSRADWTAGGFYYNAHSSLGGYVPIQPLNYFGFIPPFGQNDRFETTNKSAFLHVVTNLTAKLALTTGVRYTDESKKYNFDHPGYLTIAEPALSADTRTDWKLGLDYKLTDEHLVYGLISTGFRSAGFNPRPFTPGQVLPFPQEQMKNYEVGAKLQFFDNRLRVNTAIFYTEYDPRLILIFARQCDPSTAVPPVIGIGPTPTNIPCPAGTARAGQLGDSWLYYAPSSGNVKGAELEIEARPIERLSINGSLGFNTFRAQNRDPKSLLQPEWNASAGMQYDIPLGGAGTLTPRLDWFYQSHGTNNPDPAVAPREPDEIVPSYALVNGRLTYANSDRDWTVSLSVTNLLDKFYYYSLSAATSLGPTGVPQEFSGRAEQPGRPREWAVTLNRRF